MAHQHAVCGAAPTEPLRRVNLRSEPFGPLQFRLISKIYEFGSRQITHPLISPIGLSQPHRREGRAGGGGGDWRTQLSANHRPLPPTRWLKAAAFFQLLGSLFSPPKSPPDTGQERKKYLSVSSQVGEASGEKRKRGGLDKRSLICRADIFDRAVGEPRPGGVGGEGVFSA